MRTGLKLKGILIAAAAALAGCFDGTTDDNGSGLAPQYYVAVGNSLTAGYQSGGLRADWQKISYPALLAKQMGVDADFQLPLIDSPGIGSKFAGITIQPLELDSTGKAIATPKPLMVDPGTLLPNKGLGRPYNNLAVPGATTHDFLYASDSGTAQDVHNGFFNIVLRGGLQGNLSMMRQAILLQPTILTMWIGSNDILGGVTAGNIVEGQTVTPTAAYSAMMDAALDTLLRETQAHIFLANIPSITSIPFVTAVPNWIFKPDLTPAKDTATKFLTVEENVKYVLLPALTSIKAGKGIPTAFGGTNEKLGADLTLTEAEAATAEKLVGEYNAYLKGKCDANPDRLTLVDVNGLLGRLVKKEIPGLSSGFVLFDSTSAFSLDGIHPNAAGYRQVANLYIDAIDKALGKDYKHVGE